MVVATEFKNVALSIDEPAARITLNRPEKRNALSLELMQEVIAALREASAHPGVRAIVIEGAGAAFSAGHDLAEEVRHRLLHEVPRLELAFIHVNPCGHDGTDVHALTRHHASRRSSERTATIVRADDGARR